MDFCEFAQSCLFLQDHDNQAAEPLPRVIPKIDDPNVAKRNRRMFGALLGTLEVNFVFYP